jgi:hypothetical protein
MKSAIKLSSLDGSFEMILQIALNVSLPRNEVLRGEKSSVSFELWVQVSQL